MERALRWGTSVFCFFSFFTLLLAIAGRGFLVLAGFTMQDGGDDVLSLSKLRDDIPGTARIFLFLILDRATLSF
jgi:hypothetical protein